MKKTRFLARITAIILTIIGVVGITGVLSACDNKPKERYTYAIFTDNYGTEYRVGVRTSEYARVTYDKDKTYQFSYKIYYEDTNEPTGEAGSIPTNGYHEVGQYYIPAPINHSPKYEFVLQFVIQERIKIQPEMKIDPNGAIEFTEGERYVYRFGSGTRYPIVYGIDGDRKLMPSSDMNYDGIALCYNQNNQLTLYPSHIGTFSVTYNVWKYENEEDNENYKSIGASLIVEIVE